ncbi:unnamed protein product [Gulo gulo]|uniref:Uncharacterized protein n=1 Tax=Gulo gulo TaxID=48420 RepID=A0A9X9LHA4_GULGU|nr:unnamed protein product [Gulo gulo]
MFPLLLFQQNLPRMCSSCSSRFGNRPYSLSFGEQLIRQNQWEEPQAHYSETICDL